MQITLLQSELFRNLSNKGFEKETKFELVNIPLGALSVELRRLSSLVKNGLKKFLSMAVKLAVLFTSKSIVNTQLEETLISGRVQNEASSLARTKNPEHSDTSCATLEISKLKDRQVRDLHGRCRRQSG